MATKRSAAKVRELRPNTAPNDKLDTALSRIRQLAGEGENTQVSMMKALMELFEHKEIWGSRYDTWDGLLYGEGFCTPTRFENFVKAYGEFGDKETRKLGVNAATLIIQQKGHVRTKVLAEIHEWMKTHHVPPTTQRVATEVRKIIGANTQKRKGGQSKDERITALGSAKRNLSRQNKNLVEFNTKLTRHIWKLNGLLKQKGVEPPKMPTDPNAKSE